MFLIYSFRSFRQLLSCITAFCNAEVYWLKETDSRENLLSSSKLGGKKRVKALGPGHILFSADLQRTQRTTSSARTHLFVCDISPTSIVANCQWVNLQIRLRHHDLITSLRPFWSKSWLSERLTRLTKL